MPNGVTHTTATVLTAVALSTSDVGSLAVAGALTGIILSPDLDVDNGFIGFKLIQKIWIIGKPLSIFWRAIWYPYAKVVSHRSFVSHSPGISTVIRLAYLAVVCLPIWKALYDLGFSFSPEYLPFVYGLMIADMVHIAMDVTQGAYVYARRKIRN